MVFLLNKYTKWYYNIVENAKIRDNSSLVVEKHHIVPDCMYKARKRKGKPGHIEGNPDDIRNIVCLTIREHFLCHWLLTKMVEQKYKAAMQYGLFMMSRSSKLHTRNLSAWQVSKCRESVRTALTGRTLSNETKEKIAKKVSKKLKGRKQSKEHIENRTKFLRGSTKTEEHKNKISQSKKGKPSYIRTPEIIEKNRKNRIGATQNYKWWSKGNQSTQSPVCPGPDWVPGRINIRRAESQ